MCNLSTFVCPMCFQSIFFGFCTVVCVQWAGHQLAQCELISVEMLLQNNQSLSCSLTMANTMAYQVLVIERA